MAITPIFLCQFMCKLHSAGIGSTTINTSMTKFVLPARIYASDCADYNCLQSSCPVEPDWLTQQESLEQDRSEVQAGNNHGSDANVAELAAGEQHHVEVQDGEFDERIRGCPCRLASSEDDEGSTAILWCNVDHVVTGTRPCHRYDAYQLRDPRLRFSYTYR